MGRPRNITLESGTVSLMGFPTEVAEKLQEYITKFSPAVEEKPFSLDDAPIVELKSFPDKTVGLRLNAKKVYELVSISYNSDTQDAVVDSVKLVSDVKILAQNALKVELVRLKII